jgi:transposase InsO family protein
MVMDKTLLHNVVSLTNPVQIAVGNKDYVYAKEKGTLSVSGVSVPALYVPALARNLLSVSQIASVAEGAWQFSPQSAEFRQHGSKLPSLSSSLENGLYILSSGTPTSHQTSYLAETLVSSWHRRLGHLNVDDVVRLGKAERLDGKDYWYGQARQDRNAFQCPSCIKGGGKRLPTHLHANRATQPLALIHVDLFGPTQFPGANGEGYMVAIYNDYTRQYLTTCLRNKTTELVTSVIKDYISNGETQTGYKCKIMRSDRGSEFISQVCQSYLRSKGIEHQLTAPDLHAQNGRIERAISTITAKTQTLMIESRLPTRYWTYAAQFAVYTLNRSPAGPAKMIPKDRWRSRPIHHYNLQPFGSALWFRNHTESNKLAQRYIEGKLLGYVVGTHNYIILDERGSNCTIERCGIR